MQVKTLKTIYHDKLGKVNPGQIIELNDSQVKIYLERNAVQVYSTKVVEEQPEEAKIVEDKPKRGRKPA